MPRHYYVLEIGGFLVGILVTFQISNTQKLEFYRNFRYFTFMFKSGMPWYSYVYKIVGFWLDFDSSSDFKPF